MQEASTPTAKNQTLMPLLKWALVLATLSYSAFTHREDIKHGWHDGWNHSYNPPANSK